jgi:hypothetical protein
MPKAYMTFMLMVLFLMTGYSAEVSAKSVKEKSKSSKSYVSKKKKSKKNRIVKERRYRRSGTGPDLRTLTTEKPNTEYIENPVNGVNPLEKKSEFK